MIIGLTGRIAGGKGVASDFFRAKGFEYLSLSNEVREEANKRGLPLERKSLQDLGNLMRKEEGSSVLAKRVIKKIKKKKTDLRNVVGLIDFSNKNIGHQIESFEVIGTDQNIKRIIKEYKINEVIFSSGEIAYNKMMEIVAKCSGENVEFKIVGSNLDFIVGKTAVTMLDDMPVIELSYNITLPQQKFIKTILDYSIVIPSLIFIYPFIFFKSKLVNKQSDFTKFIMGFPKVFIGQLSLVGPKEGTLQTESFLGKTGLTGYWYIDTENSDDIEKLNFYYAKNQNIWLDLEILAKSLNKMWSKK